MSDITRVSRIRVPLPRITVIMPTYRHVQYIGRALESLRAQTLRDWELIVVDDASPDATARIVASFAEDNRIQYHRLPVNSGFGTALNYGLACARAPLIAYLPSDDVYYPDHLAGLAAALRDHPGAVLAHADLPASGAPPTARPLQLVQVMHRAVDERWAQRYEFVTDDLERMFWTRLRSRGEFVASGRATCEWTDLPQQHHKLIAAPDGLAAYRDYYDVRYPLRFQPSVGEWIDELQTQPRRPVKVPLQPIGAISLREAEAAAEMVLIAGAMDPGPTIS